MAGARKLQFITISCMLLAVGLAGCSDSSSPEPPSNLPPPKQVQTNGSLGAISGVVVSPTIVPIAGANLSITGSDHIATTDENGLFAFEGLEPGTYFIAAIAEGHLAVQQNVEVQAGKVANPRLMLPFDTSPKPYHQSYQFNGRMTVSDFYGVYVLTDTLGNNDLCTCIFEFSASPGPATVVVEGIWESSTPRAEEHDMYWEIWTESSGTQSTWGSSPTLWHVDGSVFGKDTDWTMQISSGEQPDIEQEFEGFVTFFYIDPAPAGWSLVAGDA